MNKISPKKNKQDWKKTPWSLERTSRDAYPKKEPRKKEQMQRIDAKVDISSFNSIDLSNPNIKPLLDILDIIAEAELGHDAGNYNAIYIRWSATRKINERYVNQWKLFTDMTLTEIEQVQTEFLRLQKWAWKSWAIWRYQIVRREIRNFLSQWISPNTIFSSATQDKLALLLMRDAWVWIWRSTWKVNRIAWKWIWLKSKPSLKRKISEKLSEFDKLNWY